MFEAERGAIAALGTASTEKLYRVPYLVKVLLVITRRGGKVTVSGKISVPLRLPHSEFRIVKSRAFDTIETRTLT